jgi:lysophospholipase L1-like esterase
MLSKILLISCVLIQLVTEDPVAKYREAATKKWEAEIKKLEKLDGQEVDPAHAILFIGSSSIRRWETIAEDMAPWPTIRRGYGGAKLADLAVFVERMIKPHQFDALAIFVGNDITGSDADRSPEEVLELYQCVVAKVRESRPEQPIFFIAITPTGKRFHVWDKIQRANKLIEEYCTAERGLYFVSTADKFLKEDSRPNDALFVEDRLHLNEEGYRIWAAILKEAFAKVMKPQ